MWLLTYFCDTRSRTGALGISPNLSVQLPGEPLAALDLGVKRFVSACGESKLLKSCPRLMVVTIASGCVGASRFAGEHSARLRFRFEYSSYSGTYVFLFSYTLEHQMWAGSVDSVNTRVYLPISKRSFLESWRKYRRRSSRFSAYECR